MSKTTCVPTSAPICCQYEWNLELSNNTLFLSEFIGIPDLVPKAFRLAAETSEVYEGYRWKRQVRLSCYINSIELNRLGYVARSATCIGILKGGMNFWELEQVGDGQTSAVLFVRDGIPIEDYGKVQFTFRLHFSGWVDQFCSQRFDAHLGQQLWTASVNKQMTDVIFQVGSSTFPAHRFVLVARSPVFRAMFDTDMIESRTGKVQIGDVGDPGTFEQFLRFLYTGKLDKPVPQDSQQLLEFIAEKYQVQTLISLCRAVVANEVTTKEGLLACTTSKLARKKFCERTVIETSHATPARHLPHQADLLSTETYVVQNASEHKDKGAQWILNGVFLYKLQTPTSSMDVSFHSSWVKGLAWRVSSVDLAVHSSDERILARTSMRPVVSQECIDKQPLQVFTANIASVKEAKFDFHFVVHLVSVVNNFQHQLRDSLFAQELWSSAMNKERTDVEFKVGDKTFPAHRALLAARCPALAALVPAKSSPTSPAKVPIVTVDPVVFEKVLYFLYTGSLKSPNVDDSLLEAAKSYKIETLSVIGMASGGRQQLDQDQLSKAILSSL